MSNVRNTWSQNSSALPDGKNILYMSTNLAGVKRPFGQSCCNDKTEKCHYLPIRKLVFTFISFNSNLSENARMEERIAAGLCIKSNWTYGIPQTKCSVSKKYTLLVGWFYHQYAVWFNILIDSIIMYISCNGIMCKRIVHLLYERMRSETQYQKVYGWIRYTSSQREHVKTQNKAEFCAFRWF